MIPLACVVIESNSQKQKVEWWLSGVGVEDRELFNGDRVSVLQDEKVLEIGCTTM